MEVIGGSIFTCKILVWYMIPPIKYFTWAQVLPGGRLSILMGIPFDCEYVFFLGAAFVLAVELSVAERATKALAEAADLALQCGSRVIIKQAYCKERQQTLVYQPTELEAKTNLKKKKMKETSEGGSLVNLTVKQA